MFGMDLLPGMIIGEGSRDGYPRFLLCPQFNQDCSVCDVLLGYVDSARDYLKARRNNFASKKFW